MAESLTTEGELYLSWSGTALDSGRIEAELARLRYEAAGEPAGGEGGAIRTSVLNMVVYVEDQDAAARAREVIESLAGHHPSRALVIIARPGAGESRIDAQLGAHCHITPGMEQQVCCEEVTLTVSGPAAHHLHGIIIPLLVPDLPVYVWWPADLPAEAHAFEEMMEMADHLIVDSAAFPDQAAGLLRLNRLCTETPNCSVGDLNWVRTEPWRQLIAQQASTPGMEACLQEFSSVQITYAAGERSSPAQAYLLEGWLAAHFGWSASPAWQNNAGLRVRQDGREVALQITESPYADLPAGSLISVAIRSRGDGGEGLISIVRTDDPTHLAVNVIEGDTVLEDHVQIGQAGLAELLLWELDQPLQDGHYARALRGALPVIQTLTS